MIHGAVVRQSIGPSYQPETAKLGCRKSFLVQLPSYQVVFSKLSGLGNHVVRETEGIGSTGLGQVKDGHATLQVWAAQSARTAQASEGATHGQNLKGICVEKHLIGRHAVEQSDSLRKRRNAETKA